MNTSTHETTLSFIVATIRNELTARNLVAQRLILFGSRASGAERKDSDWDFLVGITGDIGFSEKVKMTTAIQRRLAREHLSADIIIKADMAIEREKDDVGRIVHYALRTGIPV